MTLADLVRVLPDDGRIEGAPDVEIIDVTHDSRGTGRGVLYACRPGQRADGHDFAAAAVAAGSPALLVERVLEVTVPQLVVPSVARALGPVAARVHGDPSTALDLYGVTGTNGKTTSAYLLESVLRVAGHRTGLLGTVQTLIDGERQTGVRTTPESTDLQRLLHTMVDRGVTAAAMEVSSHGLALGRVAGTRFRAVLFTNLSQDHLDFHRDLEDYFAAKAALFDPAFAPAAAINLDDPYGRRLVALARGKGQEVLTYSTSGDAEADCLAEEVRCGPDGSTFTARFPGGSVVLRTRLPGAFNVANALGVLTTSILGGVPVEVSVEGIAALAGVAGRMERVDVGQSFGVIVDYAHTPDSLTRVLQAARGLTSGRVLLVIGCGGDRDHGKRPLMAHAAVSGADVAVFTSDNPRSEDPEAIVAEMLGGVGTGDAPIVELDRRQAIGVALSSADPGDVVVIAGKGHEAVQEFADRTVPFDDRIVASEWLRGAR